MTKGKVKYAKRSCCKTPRHKTEMLVAMQALEKFERQWHKYYEQLNIDPYNSLINNDSDWACDECINTMRAILANPSIQMGSAYTYKLAYYDTTHQCRNCGIDFQFTKIEKQSGFPTG